MLVKKMTKISTKKVVLIGFLGNIAEWYDFAVYAFLGVTLGKLFFAATDPKIALLKAFFLFSVSYLIRPIGAIIWGYVGDRFGRKIAFQWSLMAMAVPTLLIGLLPTYATAGIWAIVALIILRLLQGFAAGGELPVSACYVYEISPPAKKNFFCSFVAASAMFGMLCGSLAAFGVYSIFTTETVEEWAWRLPFLLGFLALLVVFYVRKNISETLDFKQNQTTLTLNNKEPFFSKIKKQDLQRAGQVFILYSFVQTAFYLLFIWMPSYLNVFVGVSKNVSFFSNTLGLLFLVLLTLIVGYLAKPLQRRKFIVFSIISLVGLSYPLFILLQSKSLLIIMLVQFIFAISLSLIDGVMVNFMAQSFDARTRCSFIGVGLVLPAAILGGVLPTLCNYFIYVTNINLIPIFFIIPIGLIALLAALKSKNI